MIAPLGARFTFASRSLRQDAGWTPLFNQHDLASWNTWLGKPYGLNTDPKSVFSVVESDGAPAVRISGEVFGALTRVRSTRTIISVSFKWGERQWPPGEEMPRASGCCYHGVGPHGASYPWLQSFEFQIQEGDCGNFYPLAGCARRKRTRRDGSQRASTKSRRPRNAAHEGAHSVPVGRS